MTLWLLLSLLLAPAMLLLALPFLRQYREAKSAGRQDVALYREQLQEVELELARGTLSAAEAEETRRDIERRALAVVKRSGGGEMGESTDKVRVVGLAVTLGWVAVGSAALYVGIGRPDLTGSQPPIRLAAQIAPGAQPAGATSSGIDLTPPPPGQAPPTEKSLADVDTMIAQLAARLEASPEDVAGWKMLGWSRLKTQDFDGAVEAFARATALAPQDDEVLSLHGEAIVRAADGRVTAEAQGLFTRALAANPRNPRAAFFAGMALDQSGRPAAALERWLELYETAAPDSEFLPGLAVRIREVADRTGFDLGDRIDSDVSSITSPGNPTREDIAAAQQMAPQDRQQMIRGMVDGLSARLEDSPDDPDGWARLIRSYTVLNDREAASRALTTARTVFAQDSSSLQRINGLAAELGLP